MESLSDPRSLILSLIVGVVGGVISVYVTKALNTYFAFRTRLDRQKRLKEIETELNLLQGLNSSDRTLLLFTFRMTFSLIGLMSIASVLPLVFRVVEDEEARRLEDGLSMSIWLLVAVFSFYAVGVLKKLDRYPESTKKLEGKRDELKSRDAPKP